jgi:hypothetical protein
LRGLSYLVVRDVPLRAGFLARLNYAEVRNDAGWGARRDASVSSYSLGVIQSERAKSLP